MAEPRNARSRRTRAALLDQARALIEHDGLAALTMNTVAERAGVTRRAVYLHFASRTELVTALFDHINATEDLAGSTRAVRAAPNAAAALDAWADHLARFHARLLAVTRAFQRAKDDDPDARRHWSLIMDDWMTGCRRLAQRLDDDAALAPPWTVDTAGDLLWVQMSPDVLGGLLVDRGWSQDQVATHLAVLLRRTLLANAQPATDTRHRSTPERELDISPDGSDGPPLPARRAPGS